MKRQTFNTAPPPPPSLCTTLSRCGLWSLMLPALFVVCAQAQAQTNTAATGAPAVTAADGADLSMVGPNEDSALTAARGDIADTDVITTFTPSWAWQQADAPASGAPMDSAYSAIAGATAATFTPLQAHVGKFIRVCATFDDDAGNSETRCWTSVAAVVNVDDAPVATDNTIDIPLGTAEYAFAFEDFTYTDEDGADDLPASVRIETVPATGTGSIIIANIVRQGGVDSVVFRLDFGGNSTPKYRLPDDAVTPAAGYASFTFSMRSFGGTRSNTATITINLVEAENIRLRLRLFLEGPLR